MADLWANGISLIALLVSIGTLAWTSSKKHPSNKNSSRAAGAAEDAVSQAKQANVIAESAVVASATANKLSEEANETANDALILAKSDSKREFFQTISPLANNAAVALHDYWRIFRTRPPVNGFDPPYLEAVSNVVSMRSIAPKNSPMDLFLGAVQDVLNSTSLTRLIYFGHNRARIADSGEGMLEELEALAEEAEQLPFFAMVHMYKVALSDPHSDVFVEPEKLLMERVTKIHDRNRPLWKALDAEYPGNFI